jgi:hypothetical protein
LLRKDDLNKRPYIHTSARDRSGNGGGAASAATEATADPRRARKAAPKQVLALTERILIFEQTGNIFDVGF